MKKQAWAMCPAGPLGWNSYHQIFPELKKVWSSLSVRIEEIWYPRPKIEASWVKDLKESATSLIFPLGIAHYDALWTLQQLRMNFDVQTPAVIMFASDFTKGFGISKKYASVFRQGDTFITNCSAEADLARMALGKNINVIPIPLSVDTDFFKPLSHFQRQELRGRWGVKSNEFLVTYAGRVSLQKNIHLVLQAFAEFRRHQPDSSFFIVGPYDDIGAPHLPSQRKHRYMHELSALVLGLGLEKNVRFIGAVEQPSLRDYLGVSDCHISLSTHSGEDFGYTVAQGLAMGATTVLSYWGGHKDFVQKCGVAGIQCKVGTSGLEINLSNAIAELHRISASDSRTRVRTRARIRDQAVRHFSTSNVSRAWKKVLEQKPISKKSLAFKPSRLFLEQEGPRFSSGNDPLYLKICDIYSG